MSATTRTRLASSLLLLLVFASGMLLGAALDRRLEGAQGTPDSADRLATESADGTEVGSPVGGPDDTADAAEAGTEPDAPAASNDEGRRAPMYERVGLRPDQALRIDSVVTRYRERVRELRAQASADYDAAYWQLVVTARDSIKGLMDVTQRAEYDALLEASDERRQTREDSVDGPIPSGSRN